MGSAASAPAEASSPELILFLKTAIKEGDVAGFEILTSQLATPSQNETPEWLADAGSMLHSLFDAAVSQSSTFLGDVHERMLQTILLHPDIPLEAVERGETPLQHAARLGLCSMACLIFLSVPSRRRLMRILSCLLSLSNSAAS